MSFVESIVVEIVAGAALQVLVGVWNARRKLADGFAGEHTMRLMDEMSRRTNILLDDLSLNLADQADFIRPRTERLLAHKGKLQFVATDAKNTGGPVAMQRGDVIYLCVSDNPAPDILFAIVLHELAHYMEAPSEQKMGSNGHSVHGQQFKDDERWLQSHASDLGIGSRASPIHRNYCGIVIPDPAGAV